MYSRVRIAFLAGLVCMFTVARVQAQHDHQHDHDHDHDHAHGGQEQGQAGMDEQMQQWMALGQPGEEHKNLEPMIGVWNVEVKMWNDPAGEPDVSRGRSVNKWIMDGRYLHSEYEGEFMGEAFKGMGLWGYDRITNEYFSTWIDSMSTTFMLDRGQYKADEKQFLMKGTHPMPGGGTLQTKSEVKIHGKDKHVMTAYHQMPGQQEFAKVMELTFTRAGQAGNAGAGG